MGKEAIKPRKPREMKSRTQPSQQGTFLLPDLRSQLDRRQGLYRLAHQIDWSRFEMEFGALYSEEGRTALPIRRMVGLLLYQTLIGKIL